MTTKAKHLQFRSAAQVDTKLNVFARVVRFAAASFFCIKLFLPLSAYASGINSDAELSHLKRAVVSNYAALVSASYQDSLAAAGKLKSDVEAFLARPSEAALRAARESWRAARVPYCQTEVYRFYDGPIDQIEGTINAWPIDENYIDYVAENPEAGVINAVSNFPALTRELLLSLNEKEGEKNISTGFHAIEFLLWGQDQSSTGPGNRSWVDYTDKAKNWERRRQCLRIVTELLVESLKTVASEWAEQNPQNYRARFLNDNTDESLAKILKGIGALSGPELAGERLTVPYETKEQEDEHSCFSDNTRDDVVYDALGIENVYFGRYKGVNGGAVSGPGLHELLQHVSPSLAARMATQTKTIVAAARDIPQPFDQSMLGKNGSPGRVALKKAITAFQAESDLTTQVAKTLELNLHL